MKIYQLHFEGKNRAYHNFKTEDEALTHQERLIRYIKDRIAEGQLGFKQYLREAKNLEVVEITIERNNHFYSVVEYAPRCCGIVKSFKDKKHAEYYLKELQENSTRIFRIMESKVNANESENYSRKRRDSRGS